MISFKVETDLMRVRYQVNPDLQLEFEVQGVKELMKQLSQVGELFGIKSCDLCQGSDIIPQHRRSRDGHEFYGLKCVSCNAQFDFGQHKEGETLFAKQDRGWYQYESRGETTYTKEGSAF